MTGCFVKPSPPAPSGAACAPFGPWSDPIKVGGSYMMGDNVESPWLSADGTELWFTANTGTGTFDVFRATGSLVSFDNATRADAIDTSSDDDNACFMTDERTLFFDRGKATIYETTRSDGMLGFGPQIPHSELMVGIEPWISPDGLTIVYAQADGPSHGLSRATRDAVGGTFNAPVSLDA